ncbi:MAG: hypothetical protein AAGC76_07860 [Luteibacter sp.]|nr:MULTISPECIES: hypothetical protein [unclassified Luteibacter]MDQ7995753.1 hypothetical protein [Luteibacter sp.]MDR6642461.1 hypothetical protein [Luteibacter sp. 1214]SKB53565.1 hypothetical protein SAMN05660880_01479 [Luteibacter sp. 22Crub2.1]
MAQDIEKNDVLNLQSLEIDWEDLFHACLSIASSTSTANDGGC